MTRLPLLGNLMIRMLFEGDDLVHLLKDRVVQLEVNAAIEQPDSTVLPSQVVHHFIDRASTHWMMDFCICRESSHCRDYPSDLGYLFMGEAMRRIDPLLGRLVTREEAQEHVRSAVEAGMFYLVAAKNWTLYGWTQAQRRD